MTHIKSRKHSTPRSHARSQARGSSHLAVSVMTALALGSPAAALAAHGPDAGSGALADGTAGAMVKQHGGDTEHHGRHDNDKARHLPRVDVEATATQGYRADSLSPKFTQPLLDTTQTVQVITNDLFLQQGAATLTEVLRNSAGVGTFYVGENGNTTTGAAIRMRGFDASGSIFVDGVRDLGSITRDIFNIQQVEVTKGPDGTQFGRTAPTGAINMVTKQPFLEPMVAATVSWGDGPQRRATADWNQPLGAHSAMRLNVMWQNSGVPGRQHVQNDRWGIAPSLAFGLGTPTRVYLNLLHVEQSNVPDGGVFTIGLPGYSSPDPDRPEIGHAPKVDPSTFYGTDQDHDDVTANMVTLRVAHDINKRMSLRNTTRWGRTRQDYLISAFMGSAGRLITPDINDPSSWQLKRTLPNFKHQQHYIITNQTNLHARFDAGAIQHELSMGLELTREKVHSVDLATTDGAGWLPANVYDPEYHVPDVAYGPTGAWGAGHTDTYAIYLFDTAKVGPHWQVNVGARWDHYRATYKNVGLCGARWWQPQCLPGKPIGSPVKTVDATASNNLFSWKLGVLYKPMEIGSIYVNYATSAQPPGGQSLVLSSSSRSANNPKFEPQQARTVELGTKWDLFERRLLLSAALYRTEVDNQLERDPVSQEYFQSGKKRVQGVEITAVGKITERWSLTAGYTIMDAEIVEGAADANDGSMNLTYTPDSAFTSWTAYRFPFGLTIGGGVRYNGGMHRGRDGARGTPEFTRSYWVANAMASYAFTHNMSLRLNVYNLTDEDYVAAINKSGYRYTPGRPRSAMLTFSVSF